MQEGVLMPKTTVDKAHTNFQMPPVPSDDTSKLKQILASPPASNPNQTVGDSIADDLADGKLILNPPASARTNHTGPTEFRQIPQEYSFQSVRKDNLKQPTDLEQSLPAALPTGWDGTTADWSTSGVSR